MPSCGRSYSAQQKADGLTELDGGDFHGLSLHGNQIITVKLASSTVKKETAKRIDGNKNEPQIDADKRRLESSADYVG